MFTVYVLYSKAFNKIYIGYTTDVSNRLLSHNELATRGHTMKYRPWIIAFTETYNTKKEALIREKQLKGGRGREFIWDFIKKNLLSNSDD